MGESENEKFLKNLRSYIKKRDIEKIQALITNPGFDVNLRDLTHDLQTPLMKLCYSEIHDSSLLVIIDLLLDRNADLNIQDSLGRTAVMHACIARRTILADYLISDPTTRLEIFDFDGNSVLTHAVKCIDNILTKRILDHPAGPALLEIYNSNGQKALNIAIKIGNKKLIKLIEQYETKKPTVKSKEKQMMHEIDASTYSPRIERNVTVKRGKNNPMALKLDTSSPDSSDHAISLTSARLGRSKKTSDMFSPDLILPSITEKVEKTQTVKSDSSLSRRKARRNSVSLPDLRDTPNCLVRSGDNTPSILNMNTPDVDEYDDEDDSAFINVHISPRKKPERKQSFRKCLSENQLSFPSIVNKMSKSNSNVKRTLTESSIYSSSDDGLSRNIQKLL